MGRKYTKVEHLAEIIKKRKSSGETNREIGEKLMESGESGAGSSAMQERL